MWYAADSGPQPSYDGLHLSNESEHKLILMCTFANLIKLHYFAKSSIFSSDKGGKGRIS